MMRVTRRYRFAASHRLHLDHLTEDQNRELYGKCNNPYGHGHDYILDVTVSGPRDSATGLEVPLPKLDKLVSEQVLQDFDNRYFNAVFSVFVRFVPTSENIIRVIEERLKAHWKSAFTGTWPRLDKIRLQETKRNSFELTESETNQ
jgi:6-pyruvoyltetrahydropterin/6-carboxytetrahydropterin synthase